MFQVAAKPQELAQPSNKGHPPSGVQTKHGCYRPHAPLQTFQRLGSPTPKGIHYRLPQISTEAYREYREVTDFVVCKMAAYSNARAC